MENKENKKENEDIKNKEEEIEKNEVMLDINKQEKQIKKIFIIGVLIFIIFFLILFFINESKNFVYGGIKFKKIKMGNLNLYYSLLPVRNMAGNVIANFNLYLRNDPRELEYIPINTTINLKKDMTVSLGPKADRCSYGAVSTNFLSQFLLASGINYDVASINETYAKQKKIKYANCENSTNEKIVLVIKKGNSTIINKEKEGCYVIEFADCSEMQGAIERFVVGAIANSRGREI